MSSGVIVSGNILERNALTLKRLFVGSMALQGVIAFAQMLLQQSVGLSILGEPLIGPEISGVAKWSLAGHTLIRAYGTFPHANVLAGFALMALMNLNAVPKKYRLWVGILVGIGFVLALSKAAFLAGLIALILFKKIPKRRGIPALVILAVTIRLMFPLILEKEFVQERIQYIKISAEMALEHPEGVGLAQFTDRMQAFTEFKLQPWQFQPVHNIYLLVLNEDGIWALLFLLIGIKHWWKAGKRTHPMLIAFLIIGLFDHYLITLPQGLLLIGLIVGLTTVPMTPGPVQNQGSHA